MLVQADDISHEQVFDMRVADLRGQLQGWALALGLFRYHRKMRPFILGRTVKAACSEGAAVHVYGRACHPAR